MKNKYALIFISTSAVAMVALYDCFSVGSIFSQKHIIIPVTHPLMLAVAFFNVEKMWLTALLVFGLTIGDIGAVLLL